MTISLLLLSFALTPFPHKALAQQAPPGLLFNDGFNVGDTGFAGLLGAGYELRLGRRIYLNPTVDLVGHSYSGRLGGGYTERLVNFGFGVLFQTGK